MRSMHISSGRAAILPVDTFEANTASACITVPCRQAMYIAIWVSDLVSSYHLLSLASQPFTKSKEV